MAPSLLRGCAYAFLVSSALASPIAAPEAAGEVEARASTTCNNPKSFVLQLTSGGGKMDGQYGRALYSSFQFPLGTQSISDATTLHMNKQGYMYYYPSGSTEKEYITIVKNNPGYQSPHAFYYTNDYKNASNNEIPPVCSISSSCALSCHQTILGYDWTDLYISLYGAKSAGLGNSSYDATTWAPATYLVIPTS